MDIEQGLSRRRFIPTYVGYTRGRPAPCFCVRFIPTYVGYTHANNPAISRCTVHPHIRGAYSVYPSFLPSVFGSSPPTWGIRASGLTDTTPSRFIPTYVGHTSSNRDAEITITVHPHLRGAYMRPVGSVPALPGSSPPTWGIRHFSFFIPITCWFIPTYVGHTIAVCGRSWPVPGPARFIPTYVGHTYFPRMRVCRASVHPHLRGAYA